MLILGSYAGKNPCGWLRTVHGPKLAVSGLRAADLKACGERRLEARCEATLPADRREIVREQHNPPFWA
jgi:hypothetical protein